SISCGRPTPARSGSGRTPRARTRSRRTSSSSPLVSSWFRTGRRCSPVAARSRPRPSPLRSWCSASPACPAASRPRAQELKMPEPKIAIEEETQDLAFLGREFMTWLLWRADRGEATFVDDDGELTVAFGGRARLLGVGADVTDAVLKGRSPAHGVETRAG